MLKLPRPHWRHLVAAGFAVTLFALAFAALGREFRAHSVAEILLDLRAMPRGRILGAVGFTGLAYVALTGYDALAAMYAGVRLPYRRTALASSVGYAFSQTLGFPLLTGAPIRYRLYTAWGVEAPDLTRMLAFTSGTMWLGVLVLAGATFVLEPAALVGLPAAQRVARPLGIACLVTVVGYLSICVRGASVTLRAWTVAAPPLRLAMGQLMVSTSDWAFSGAALYVLIPPEVAPPFSVFFGAYLVAQVSGLLSHIPGGLGVFEAVMLLMLGGAAADDGLVAPLLVFRAIYSFLPLLLAAIALGTFEVLQRGTGLGKTIRVVGAGISSVVPVVLAGVVFVTGGLLLAGGALPFGRYPPGPGIVPSLPLVEAAHFFASVGGAGLLILAWGLYRRLDGAFQTTLVVLAVSAVFGVLRGAGWVPAAVPALVLLALLPARREFFRRSSLTADLLSPAWILGVAGVVLATAWLGMFTFRSVEYSSALWWQFAVDADAPRFLRGSVGAALVLLGFAVARLLRPAEPVEAAVPAEVTAELAQVVRSSPDVHAWLALLGDKSLLRSPSGRSFIMYGVEGRAWIAMGDPVGDPGEFAELVWRFRDRVRLFGGWPAFYQVHPEYLPLYIDAGLSLVKLGEEAIVPLDSFSLDGGARANLRKAVRKAERDGADFEVLAPAQVTDVLPRLREISDLWLLQKSAREKRFSLGAFSEEYIARSPVAVVRAGGEIVAFANMWPGAPGSEISVDLIRYDSERAPEDSMLYLLTQTMLWGRQNGYQRFSLGMAPFSGLDTGPLASPWSRIGSAVFRHGEHFYNFRGLRAFKDKWDPSWEPRYLASPGGTALPGVLAGASSLISGRGAGRLP